MTIANTISSIILCFDTLVIAKIRLTKIMQYRRPVAIPNQRIQWYFVIGDAIWYRIIKPTIARMIVQDVDTSVSLTRNSIQNM